MVARKYPTVSLCLDSSAFSCKCSLRSMWLEDDAVLYKCYLDFRIVRIAMFLWCLHVIVLFIG
jgi:hypothetical protein